MIPFSPLAYLGSFLVLFSPADTEDPVHFTFSAHKKPGKVYEIHLSAVTDPGWHIYSQEQPAEAVAQPTKIVFDKNPLLTTDGPVKEVGEKERYEDKTAGIIQYQYSKVDFVQSFKLKATAKTVLTGKVTYQSCTNEKCLPPKTVSFSIHIE